MPRRSIIIILSLAVAIVLVGTALSVSAADSNCALKFTPAVGIPGSTVFKAGQEMTLNCSSVGEYIKAIYTFAVYAGSIVAVVVLMVGGYLWLTAGGSTTQIGQAKAYIGGAISGFMLLLLSWTLLQTVNPKLVEFKPLKIESIKNVAIVSKDSCCICRSSSDQSLTRCVEMSSTGYNTQEYCESQSTDEVDCKVQSTCTSEPRCAIQLGYMGACGGGSSTSRLCAENADYTCNKAYDCSTSNDGTDRNLTKGDSVAGSSFIGCCKKKQDIGGPCAQNFDCASGYCDRGGGALPAYGHCGVAP